MMWAHLLIMSKHKDILIISTMTTSQSVVQGSLLESTYRVQVVHPGNTLRWRHNDHDEVSNHQPHGCLLNRLFRRRSKKTSKLRVTGLCVGNSPGPVNSAHKGPVTRKMFPFDDVIMRHHKSSQIKNQKHVGVLSRSTSHRWSMLD